MNFLSYFYINFLVFSAITFLDVFTFINYLSCTLIYYSSLFLTVGLSFNKSFKFITYKSPGIFVYISYSNAPFV